MQRGCSLNLTSCEQVLLACFKGFLTHGIWGGGGIGSKLTGCVVKTEWSYRV